MHTSHLWISFHTQIWPTFRNVHISAHFAWVNMRRNFEWRQHFIHAQSFTASNITSYSAEPIHILLYHRYDVIWNTCIYAIIEFALNMSCLSLKANKLAIVGLTDIFQCRHTLSRNQLICSDGNVRNAPNMMPNEKYDR